MITVALEYKMPVCILDDKSGLKSNFTLSFLLSEPIYILYFGSGHPSFVWKSVQYVRSFLT